ncbi:MAG: hypothetical protein A3C84_02850 [Candidatus Ryanbacteria bacterium RIFCSPHIGHO2_02_FULL_48_12]|uniref:Uncharacterized protein n=1 Tax=Candidatus Ryanbacteria bacterium RIFCSPHIGHO2_01_FULL_48_27 TaxID=1802115 RepID=A0A1G2G4U3_9BACT|nr:MAG: hypothetical protein A2756_01320 [Candidatus Ryanbacteria bacterium RIFCSPHIGHO2_01_FULL_48_27]OGZ49042.1 MAG: hypothetical protein A3C84_02850 [Candidatus Ryanbacteria bacterium RIFCSPHIGHO2_02_FULL_48_12]
MATKKYKQDPWRIALVSTLVILCVIMVGFLSVEITNHYQKAGAPVVAQKHYQAANTASVVPLPPPPPSAPPAPPIAE